MNKKRYLVITNSISNDTIFVWGENSPQCHAYRDMSNFLFKIMQRIGLWLHIDMLSFSSDFYRYDFKKYDAIVIEECIYPEEIIRFIRKKNIACKIFYWLWNPIESSIGKARFYNDLEHWNVLLSLQKKYNFEVCSFDKNDCLTYGLIYHHQVAPFFENVSNKILYPCTIFFCGNDKGRLYLLNKLYKVFSQLGIKSYFKIVPNASVSYSDNAFKYVKKATPCTYDHLIQEELAFPAVLEILQDGQGGITWRALEALFYKRKLITNFKGIKEYDFYSPNNIFILGEDDKKNLKQFIESPFKNISPSIVHRYTFDGWINSLMN